MKLTGEVTVAPVENDATLEEFLRLPWRIYQGDPYWVPPILSEQRKFLDPRRGSFFEIGEARYFLAYQDGRPVGRLSAHINRLHDQYHGPETGFFGFFESIQNQDVATALFEAAADWLRKRGKTRLVGPLNFGIYDEMGLLVEGFDSMPVMFQTHNPPYYEELLTSLGFAKAMDWHAYKLTIRNENLDAMERRYAEIMEGQSVEVVTYDSKQVDRRADEVFHLFNEAWEPNWGHVPLTRRQFDDMLEMVKPCLRPELAYVLLDKTGWPVSASACRTSIRLSGNSMDVSRSGETSPALLGQIPTGPQDQGPGSGDQPTLSAATLALSPDSARLYSSGETYSL